MARFLMLHGGTTRNRIALALLVTIVMVICCGFLFSVIKTDMINDTVSHETALAETVIKSTRYAMLKDDRVTIQNMIRNIGERDGVEHLRIFNKKGLIMFSTNPEEINRIVDKHAAGCIACHFGPVVATRMGRMEQARRFVNPQGKHVLAITAPIYNDPDCHTAACHFHSRDQKLLGTLDIGISEAPLHKTLATMGRTIAVFCIVATALILAGLAILLKQSTD